MTFLQVTFWAVIAKFCKAYEAFDTFHIYRIIYIIYMLFKNHHIKRWMFEANPWASYQIRKIAGCACAGNAGNVFPRRRFQRKLLVSDPGMHHGTCVTHVPWCMSGSLTCGDGENVPGIPGACAPAISRIWQEAHWGSVLSYGLYVRRTGDKQWPASIII